MSFDQFFPDDVLALNGRLRPFDGDIKQIFGAFCKMAAEQEAKTAMFVISEPGKQDVLFEQLVKLTSKTIIHTATMQHVWIGYMGHIAIYNSPALRESNDLIRDFTVKAKAAGVPQSLMGILAGRLDISPQPPTKIQCSACKEIRCADEVQRQCVKCRSKLCDVCCTAGARSAMHDDQLKLVDHMPHTSHTVFASVGCPVCSSENAVVYPITIESSH